MELSPERLGMREEGIQPCNEWCTPEFGGCPAVGLERRGSRQRERGGLEEGEHVGYERAAIGDDLWWGREVRGMDTVTTTK